MLLYAAYPLKCGNRKSGKPNYRFLKYVIENISELLVF